MKNTSTLFIKRLKLGIYKRIVKNRSKNLQSLFAVKLSLMPKIPNHLKNKQPDTRND